VKKDRRKISFGVASVCGADTFGLVRIDRKSVLNAVLSTELCEINFQSPKNLRGG